MTTRDELKKKMKEKSAESAAKADALLEDELTALRMATKTDLEAIRPKITDQQTYDQLLKITDESRQNNEDIGQLRARIEKAGTQVVALAKEVYKLIK